MDFVRGKKKEQKHCTRKCIFFSKEKNGKILLSPLKFGIALLSLPSEKCTAPMIILITFINVQGIAIPILSFLGRR